MELNYEVLRIIWWALLGILLMGFAVMDGFDLGVATCLPWIARNDMDRRILINTVGPTWEGNQVWFILGGGAIFAAWPTLYALSFSGFYLAMLVVLLALILRPVGFKYRSKHDSVKWRSFWDYALFIGGFVPALIFGVAIGNVLQGVPFHFDDHMRSFYTGTFFALLNPFALFCGILSVCMLVMHGAFFLQIKTEGHLQQRSQRTGRVAALFTLVLFVLGGVWVANGIDGYVQVSEIFPNGPSNPLHKEVIRQAGAWFANYHRTILACVVPLGSIISALSAILFAKKAKLAFVSSSICIMGIIGTVGVSMFPFILPSSSNPAHSLMVWDSSSSEKTLLIMLVATIIFLPIVLAYTSWVYRVLRGKINMQSILSHKEQAY